MTAKPGMTQDAL